MRSVSANFGMRCLQAGVVGFGSEIGPGFVPDIMRDKFRPAKQLAEKAFCGSDFGFVGAPDPSAAAQGKLLVRR
jgi:hypothetical protein